MKHKKPKHKRNKRYPEPGAWVDDHSDGLPDASESLVAPKDRQLSSEEIRDEYIAYEGLGYCVYEIISPNNISDPTLRILWRHAAKALFDIVEYLETIPEQRKTTKKKIHTNKRAPPQRFAKAVDVGNDLV